MLASIAAVVSLPDALIAAALLTTGLLSLAQLLAVATNATAAAGRATHAALLAAQKVEELQASPSTRLQADMMDVPEPGLTRRWSIAALPADPEHIAVIEVVVIVGRSETRMVALKTHTEGFSLIELLIASLLTVLVLGAILAVVNPAQTIIRAQGEAADLHQRLRAAADGLTTDLRAASGVRPYRIGAVGDDGIAGVYYRSDAMSVIADTTTTYYFKAAAHELMRYDGGLSDLPMVEHVASLAFDYFGIAIPAAPTLVRIAPGELTDGPWVEDRLRRLVDQDIHRIREVRALIRLESTAPSLRRLVPDEEILLDVALRNVPVVE